MTISEVVTAQAAFFSKALASSGNGDWVGGPQAMLQGTSANGHERQRAPDAACVSTCGFQRLCNAFMSQCARRA